MQEEKEKKGKQQEENQDKIKGKHDQKRCRSGFKIVKVAVQNFDVFKVFFGNLRSRFANFVGTKKRLFLQKGGQGSSKVNTFLVYVDLWAT